MYFYRLLSNKLSHFIQRSSDNIHFTNKRIANFILKQDNIENDFYIYQQNGHEMIAKFWLTRLENPHANISFRLLKDILRHVTSSENKSFKNRLINLIHTLVKKMIFLF